MKVTVNLSAVASERAQQEAAARGVTIEEYLEGMLDVLLDPPTASPFCATPLIEKRVREQLRNFPRGTQKD